jgi:hypothetical protein
LASAGKIPGVPWCAPSESSLHNQSHPRHRETPVRRAILTLRLIPRLWCGCSGLYLNSRLICLRKSSA